MQSQDPLEEDRYDSRLVLVIDSLGRARDAELPANLVVARRPTDFEAIKDPQKNMLLYAWSPSVRLRRVIEESRVAALPTLSMTMPSEESGQAAARASDPLARWVLEELTEVLNRYAALVPNERVTTAFCKTRGQSCPLFHIDCLSVRLLCTFKGPGTEWLDDAHAQAKMARSWRQPHNRRPRCDHLFGATVSSLSAERGARLGPEGAWCGASLAAGSPWGQRAVVSPCGYGLVVRAAPPVDDGNQRSRINEGGSAHG